MAATAMIESGGNANARAKTSSAGGMFQFLDATWKQLTREMGKDYTLQDKFDPRKAAEVMAYFTEKQRKQLEKGTGRRASNTDLYMAHFLGAGGATKFLNAMNRNPNAIAADLDPRAARANRSIYYDGNRARTLAEVYELMNKKMSTAMSNVQKGNAPEFVQQMARGGGPAGGTGFDPMVAQRGNINAKLISSRPDNVKVGSSADLSGVTPDLLKRFFTAAKEFGQPINVNSAYRGDQYQAQLWVRGRILGEPGIHTPARPKNDTTITYGGKQYKVEGSGKGSKHGRGEALDISGNREAFDPYLNKYGLVRPFKRDDPPHVEMKASAGGVFTGPKSGYKAELHGTELVSPLDPNSILMQLAKMPFDKSALLDIPVAQRPKDINISGEMQGPVDTPIFDSNSMMAEMVSASSSFFEKGFPIESRADDLVPPIDAKAILAELTKTTTATAPTITPAGTDIMPKGDVSEKALAMNAELMQMLSAKLDVMIEALETGNDTSDKLLKYSRT
jgi:hypothetical protein